MRSILTLFLLCATTNLLAQNQPPNFIIFIADDVSWDDLGAYGNTDVKTPNIDRLAANGLRFDNAYLTASSCSPSRNSILTGRYPHNTGAAELHTQPPIDMQSFPELLKAAGYYTAHSGKFHSGPYVKRGFDRMINDGPSVGNGGENAWLQIVEERPEGTPFFFWFAAFDAHRAWGPNDFSGTHQGSAITPPPYLANADSTKSDLAKYYDEIFRFDHHIGTITAKLSEQGVIDNTFILIMADNGRPFPHSKTRVNDRGMKTPFVVSWPAEVKSGTSDALVSAIDIAPTITDLAGVSRSEQFQGKSFARLLRAPAQSFRNYVFAEHNWHDYEAHERMVRDTRFMYILNARPQFPQMGPADAVGSPSHADLTALKKDATITPAQADIFLAPRPSEELYDLSKDPDQWSNVANDPLYREELMRLQSVLQEWTRVTGDNVPDNLTMDWYELLPGYIKTNQHGIRGEMPGANLQAEKINESGPF
ncbi:MAG: sulfatase [Bacteroidota bacterium]